MALDPSFPMPQHIKAEGQIKERYKILEPPIGVGGMGAVYKAVDTKVGNYVAIKTIRDKPNETALRMFKQEIAVLARLNHPNIVEIIDFDELDENGTRKPYLVMPFLNGRSLDRVIDHESDALTIDRCARIIDQVCRGLHAAHQQQVVHRDVKPGNIFVLEGDWVKIIDFGVARLANITSSVGHKGTLLYMSPEQVDLKDPTAQSDIFSVGTVLYEMLARRHPFYGDEEEDIVEAIRSRKPPLVSVFNPAVNDSTCRVIYKALAKRPHSRFSTTTELAADLNRALRGERISFFDLAKIRPRLQKVHAALENSELSLAYEILDDIESEGYSDPEIDRLRGEVDQAAQRSKAQQLFETAKKYFVLAEHTLALQRVHELLELEPDHRDARILKLRIEDRLNELTIENWIKLAITHLENSDFENAREAIKNVEKQRPGLPAIADLLKEVSRREAELKEHSRLKEELYRQLLDDFRDGNFSSALHKADELITLARLDKAANPKYSTLYNQVKSTYEALSRQREDVQRLIKENSYARAISICDEVLAQHPKNLHFQALKHEAEDKQRQQRSAYIAETDRRADNESDLDRRIQILEEGLNNYPDEMRFLEGLHVARAKRELVESIIATAKFHEERREFADTIGQFEILRTIYPYYPGLDFEIARLRKRREEQVREESKARLIEAIEQALTDRLFDKALELIQSDEIPENPELEQLKKEVQQGLEDVRHAKQLLKQGIQYVEAQQHDCAITSFEEARKLDPQCEAIKEALIDSMLSLSDRLQSTDWRAADILVQKVLSIAPNNNRARELNYLLSDKKRDHAIAQALARSRELQADGQIQPAIQLVRETQKQYPGEQRLSRRLAALERSAHDRSIRDSIRTAESRINELVRDNRFLDAENLIGEFLQRHPDNPHFNELLQSVRRQHETHDRENEIKQVIESLRAVETQRNLRQLRDARARAEEWLVSYPDQVDLMDCHARLAAAEERAETELERYVTEADERVRQGDLSSALSLITAAQEIDPEENERLRNLREEVDRQRSLLHRLQVGVLESLAVLKRQLYYNNRAVLKWWFVIAAVLAIAGYVLYRWNTGKAVSQLTIHSQPRNAEITLKKILTPPSELEGLMQSANEALSATKFRAALDYARQAVKSDPQSEFGYRARAEKFIQGLERAIRRELAELPAQDRETERHLELLKVLNVVNPSADDASVELTRLIQKVDGDKDQIRRAINEKKLLPPESGNALSLLVRFSRKFPTEEAEYARDTRQLICDEVRRTADSKCPGNVECTNYVNNALEHFPGDPHLIKLGQPPFSTPGSADTKAPPPPPPLPPPPPPPTLDLITKATEAFNKGDDVLPPDYNAVSYALKVLEINSNDANAKDIRDQSSARAREKAAALLAVTGFSTALENREAATRIKQKLNEAQGIYKALDSLLKEPDDARHIADLTARLRQLDGLLSSDDYPVTHRHPLGRDCQGTLTITGFTIKYTSQNQNDAFAEKPLDLLRPVYKHKDGDSFGLGFLDSERPFNFRPTEERDGPRAGAQVDQIVRKIEEFRELRNKLRRASR